MEQCDNVAMKFYDFQIIANFLAGKGFAKKTLQDLKEFLDKHKQSYRILKIDSPTPISKLPSDGKTKIRKAVICLGGDGTVSETVGYVLNHKLKVPIAILPAGTANIIANSFGLERRTSFEFLLQNRLKKVDVGVAEYENEKDYFLLGLGIGFEEKFLKLAKEKMKNCLGIFSYILAALSELLSLRKIPLRLTVDGQTSKVEICLLVILNLKPFILRYFPLFRYREIDCQDGQFNLYYVEYRNYLYALAGTLVFHLLGRFNFGLVKTLCGQQIILESLGICGTQLDGELRSCLPVRVFLHKEPVNFLIPN